ncbi:MAG: potassium channel family protein [Methylococcaceae bacterium]
MLVDSHIQMKDFVYYSFVTLSILGYGDIVPLSATARSLAYMEAIFGQFYMAVLVAGVVSIHIRNEFRDDQ